MNHANDRGQHPGDTAGRGPNQDPLREEMLRRLRERRKRTEDFPTVDRSVPAPLSFAQQRLWILDRIEPGRVDYNSGFALDLDGPLDVPALERSLTALRHRHESLRTTFHEIDGEGRQVVAGPCELPLHVVDASGGEEAAAELVALHYAEPFDLERGPLVRAHLFRVHDTRHVLLVVLHHIVTDGWSLGVLQGELDRLYTEVLRSPGRGAAESAATLDPLPFQYVDYAAWQRDRLSGERYEASLGHWRDRLAGVEPLRMPLDRPRPPVRSMRGDSHRFRLPTETLHLLERVARDHNTNLYTVLTTAARVAMARWTGEEDVVLGTVTAGRENSRLHGLNGFFVNTLALRGRVDEEASFGENLLRTRDGVLADFDHAEVPFEAVVDTVLDDRDPSVPPLVQAAVVFQNADGGGAASLGPLDVRPFPVRREHAVFDLTLEFRVEEDTLAGSAEFNTDILDAESVARFVGDLVRILEDAEDDRPLRAVDLDGPRACSGPVGPRARTIVELMAERVALHPDALAVTGAGDTWTFAELDDRAARIAGYLRSEGVRRGDRVGVCLERGTDHALLLLAVVYAGAVHMPLDPDYPPARLAHMIEDARPAAVLTTPGFAERLPDGVRVLRPSSAWAGEPMREDLSAEDPAYLIYTSGSTGRPKGVLVPHRGIAALVATQGERMDVTPGDRMLQFASPSFDAAVAELLVALLNGAVSVLLPRGRLLGEGLPEALRTHGVTHVTLPPALLPALSPEDLGPVEHLLVAGEACPPELVGPFSRGRRMYNAYGPTESTVCATMSTPLSGAAPLPLGEPVAGTRVQILDRWLRPVREGVPGELYIGGDGLAHGYLNRPGLTATRFVADPSGPPGARMYRSGDVVRRRHDGSLEFLGRVDDQVKVRGHRVEPAEIEASLTALEGVGQAVVVASGGSTGTRLVAYVVPEDGTDLAPADLSAPAAEALPAHMLPSAIVVLERVPLTPNGKIDRRALPAVDWAAQDLTAHTEPTTEAERRLADLWTDLLGLERVGVHDGFFRVGGDSVTAVRMIARAADAFGTRLPVRAVFEHPTIAELAPMLTAGTAEDTPGLVPVARDAALPLSAAQRRLWFLDRYEPGGSEYNSGFALRLRGSLDGRALAAALATLVHRHESLRTTFEEHDGRPVQVVHPADDPDSARVDLTRVDLTARDGQTSLDPFLEEFVQRPFDLARGPLLRWSLITLGPEDHVLALGVHHIVVDAWSLSVLTKELGVLYDAAVREPRADEVDDPGGAADAALVDPADLAVRAGLPNARLQYADFAAWQDAHMESEAFGAELEYWRTTLADVEPLDLPTDHPRPLVRRGHGATHRFEVGPGTLAAVRELEVSGGLTLFMVLSAAVQVLLSRYTGREDVTVGTVVSGREHTELEDVVGFFVNTIALRTRVDESLTGSELLADVRETLLTAFQHGGVPFDAVVDAVEPERDPSRPTLVQAVVALQNAPAQEWDIGGLEATDHPLRRQHSLFDLSVDFHESEGRLLGSIEYDTDLFDPATVERIATHLCVLLDGIARAPGAPLREVGMLPSGERADLLSVGRDASSSEQVEQTGDSHVLDALTRLARRRPEAAALTAGSTTLTFHELDERVDVLAHHLAGLGIGPGDRVATLLPRTAEAVAVLFAVLRAGAAYVPVDPKAPAARARSVVSGAGVAYALTARGAEEEARALVDGAVPLLVTDDLPRSDHPAPFTDDHRVRALHGSHPAYVMYTSGSTGTPKGVVVSHANVLAAVRAYRTAVLDTDDTTGGALTAAHLAAWTFDASWDPFFWLLDGHHLHVVDEDTRVDAEALCAYLDRHRVDYLDTTPSYLNQLVAVGLLDGGRHPMSVLSVGAEALDTVLYERLASAGVRAVHNFYGPTENTVNSTVWRVREGERPRIGRPVAGTRARVLDPWLRPVPPGVYGELYLSGDSLASGYDGAPGATAERFVADPFGSGGRAYRTGDVVRWTADHELEFLGRNDDQVKIRGFRIELGEVESVVSALPGVQAATVVAREDRPGLRRLVAYVVPDPETEPIGAVEVREGAARHLPDYMVPTAVVVLEALPLNANGKTDRNALPVPDDGAFVTVGYLPPRTPTEELLVQVWGDLLGVEKVGANDNFFELGGDSILSIQMVSRVRAVGREATSKDVFLHQTLGALAEALDERETKEPSRGRVETTPLTGEVPPTPVQRWFLDTHPRHPEHFDMSLHFELAPGTDTTLVVDAARQVLVRHDMLRLRAERVDGAWRQHLDADAHDLAVRTLDASAMTEEETDRAVHAEALRERPVSRLSEGPLFEAVVVDTGERDRHRILLSAHHLVVDGVSWRVILEDLATAYDQLATGRPVDLGERTSSFPEWARRLAAHTREGGFDTDLPAWLDMVENVPALPLDHTGGANDVASQDVVTVAVPPEDAEALLSWGPGAFRSRIDDVLLAALGRVLSDWTGSHRILVEKEGHGREDLFEDVDLSRTVGWFTTIHPALLDIPEEGGWAETVAAVKRGNRAAPAGIGFGALSHLADGPETEPLRSKPEVPVSFNYLGRFGDTGEEGLVRRTLPLPTCDHAPAEERTNLLDVTGAVTGGRMEFSWTYSANRHRRSTVERLAEAFIDALGELLRAAPRRRTRPAVSRGRTRTE